MNTSLLLLVGLVSVITAAAADDVRLRFLAFVTIAVILTIFHVLADKANE